MNGVPDSPRPTGRWRRIRQGLVRATIALLLLIGASCVITPFDVRDTIRSFDEFDRRAELQNERERPQLVVLQHGMLRSSLSLWRLEEALEAHGYEVLNTSYPSTEHGIEGHSARLQAAIDERLDGRDDELPEIHFVGHSLGGLVIRHYLARPDARPASSCVFLGSPHRGAHLASTYRDSWFFQTFGGESAKQLVPGDPIYAKLPRLDVARIGCMFGTAPPEGWSTAIPGDDDGRVGVEEAQLPEQTDSVGMLLGHTQLAQDDAAIVQVLHFLKHGRFREQPV